MSNPRLAFDIETVSPQIPADQKPDFGDPTEFQLLAIGVGYQPDPTEDVATDVLFRDGWGPQAELSLIDDLAAWLDERATTGTSLLTFGGEGFDVPITHGRGRIASEDTGDESTLAALTNVLGRLEHVDVQHDAWNAFGDYTKLEHVCGHCGCSPAVTRLSEYDCGIDARDVGIFPEDPTVENTHIPKLGTYYLDWCDDDRDDSEFDALRELIYDYTASDIAPLFELDDLRPFEDVAAAV